ncbi:MAG: hypothetical protein OJF49_004675 [Ktedonobacterales bacterium]|nr:MAG: hypothetical protein OJF49_004675 [Ktedonobacterales bacterium]
MLQHTTETPASAAGALVLRILYRERAAEYLAVFPVSTFQLDKTRQLAPHSVNS